MKIVSVRVLDANGRGTSSAEIAGIDYAISAGAKVINASFGGPTGSEIVRDAIERAKSKGVLLVAAAGNDGVNADKKPLFPAAYPDSNVSPSPPPTARTSSRRSPTSAPRPSTSPRPVTGSRPRT